MISIHHSYRRRRSVQPFRATSSDATNSRVFSSVSRPSASNRAPAREIITSGRFITIPLKDKNICRRWYCAFVQPHRLRVARGLEAEIHIRDDALDIAKTTLREARVRWEEEREKLLAERDAALLEIKRLRTILRERSEA